MSFDQATLDRLRDTEEVEIETTSARGLIHRAVIWVVADEHDVYVRSVRSDRGRWYRELRDRPEGALLLAQERIAVRAVPATDDDSIELVSRLLREKYGHSSRASTDAMLLPTTLPTTLRLEPR